MYRDDIIRAEMAAQRKTEEFLAEKTGLARSTVSEIRNGKAANPTIKSLAAIADELKIPLSRLFEPRQKRSLAA
jgi:transcriptional regulator with XRE-family HTH domain